MFKVGDEVYVKAQVVDTDVKAIESYNHKVQFLDSINNEWDWVSESAISDKTYTRGLADAWELAKKIYDTTHADRNKIFGMDNSCNGIKNVFEMFTPEEALAKIEAYEKEKEIKVGDEVVHGEGSFQTKFTVTFFESNKVEGFDKNGNTHSFCYPNPYIKKTGKHIDIESLLRQIGE